MDKRIIICICHGNYTIIVTNTLSVFVLMIYSLKKRGTISLNYQYGGIMEIKRDIYLQKLINRMHNGMIKVITGIACLLFVIKLFSVIARGDSFLFMKYTTEVQRVIISNNSSNFSYRISGCF